MLSLCGRLKWRSGSASRDSGNTEKPLNGQVHRSDAKHTVDSKVSQFNFGPHVLENLNWVWLMCEPQDTSILGAVGLVMLLFSEPLLCHFMWAYVTTLIDDPGTLRQLLRWHVGIRDWNMQHVSSTSRHFSQGAFLEPAILLNFWRILQLPWMTRG